VEHDDDGKGLTEHDIELDLPSFLRTLLRHLSGTLEDVVGTAEASGFISVVGQEIGQQLGELYRRALGRDRLDPEQIAEVLVDLKRRIHGDFYVIEQNDERIVFGNRACPFGDQVEGRPSLCMMTSNVFGAIAARDSGYAKVDLEQTIASGAPGCRVVVYLRDGEAARRSEGRAYHRGVDPP